MQTILVTGHAGFIGSNLVKRLFKEMQEGTIVGIDNLNDYYDPSLKEYRLQELEKAVPVGIKYISIKGSIADRELINRLFQEYQPQIVVNLAAQAGVRYSIENPDVYIESNIIGFYNILEACRHNPVQHLVYASSSSVYGGNKKVPFSTDDQVDNPVSLYAATKKSNELMAHCYSKLYNIPSTGLRFFTVYGPAGRPDMAYFGFTNKLLKGQTIQIYNYGNCRRDFTYVDDIVEGIWRVMQKAPARQTRHSDVRLTPARAMLLYAMFCYEAHDERCSLFVANKLSYFYQMLGEEAFAKMPFVAHYYGPYSVSVAHMLSAVNGKYLHGLEEMDRKPFEALMLDYDHKAEVGEYVHTRLSAQQIEHIRQLPRLIDGYESAYALEVLASVAYVRSQEPGISLDDTLQRIEGWSQRKRDLFKREHIEAAYRHLDTMMA